MLSSATQALTDWTTAPPDLLGIRSGFLAHLDAAGEGALYKGLLPAHLTASCFVFSPDRERVLLCFHRKGRFWVQFGGHLERTDASLAAAGLREAREESGITTLELLTDDVVDVDRHSLASAFGLCQEHLDVGFIAIADDEAAVTVSDESDDVRWWPVGALPAASPPGLARRIERARQAALGVGTRP